MLRGRKVSLQIPTVVSHHDCVPVTLISGLSISSGPDWISPPARNSLNPGSQETGPYVKIGCASWHSCCSPGFWKHAVDLVIRSFWPYCSQESSSIPEQIPSTPPVPFCSLSFRTLGLWWAARSEDCQICQFSTSPLSILEKPGTSKWSSHHSCPELWWTAWLSQAWCAAVGRVCTTYFHIWTGFLRTWVQWVTSRGRDSIRTWRDRDPISESLGRSHDGWLLLESEERLSCLWAFQEFEETELQALKFEQWWSNIQCTCIYLYQSPLLMWSGGKSILSLSTRGSLMTFLSLQGTNSSRNGQSFFM